MISLNPISRLTTYFKRHGLTATFRRAGVATKRALFSNRMVLFYCDLPTLRAPAELPSRLKVERHTTQTDIAPEDLQQITSFWNPDLALPQPQ